MPRAWSTASIIPDGTENKIALRGAEPAEDAGEEYGIRNKPISSEWIGIFLLPVSEDRLASNSIDEGLERRNGEVP